MRGCVADVKQAEDRARLAAAAGEAFSGKLSIFVNNAGMNIRKATVDYSAAELDDVMGTNFTAAFALCQLLQPMLRAAPGGGSIIFNSSVAGMSRS